MTFDMSAAAVGFGREALLDGDPETAAQTLRPVVAQGKGGFEARYLLASALAAAGESAPAAAMLDEARAEHALQLAAQMGADLNQLTRDADYAASVATKLYGAANVAMSSEIWALARRAGHKSANGWLTHGLALQHQGRCEEAIAVFREVVETWPSPAAHAFMLYPHFMVEDGPRRHAAEARAWAERWAPAGTAEPDLPRRPLAGRKLRIGYVSPAFAKTQIHQFIAPVLDAHDRDAVEVFLYPASGEGEDGWRQPITVRPIGQLSDDDAAALIRADEIDVLVDCWGHSAGSRLPVFARRCAPVQAAWINFVQTTGLGRMDYVLHCDSMAAPGTEALFTEEVWPIGPVCALYRPAADRPAPHPAPARVTGRITFGSFNHPVKLTDATVAAWSRILKGRKGSRLVLKYSYFADPVLRRATHARFMAHGIAPERIEFRGWSTGPDYLREFADIDLALDPSPAPGGTTTCDALANGVPVLTLRGPDFYSRIGVSGVEGANAPELVAESWDDYVAKALALTADVAGLDALRLKVRSGIETGPYADAEGFTRRLEASFRTMVERREAEGGLRGAA